ncbi:hypothetical protein IMZ29_07810 [Achromobacter sp. GG226]|uniref:hypothetical protein n=1 Tax=Verticiella alkaliphila TaxID=2779529 RepID=UPI001C0D7863|nr:hypothetical protein [Verticiella sp. GG226]MBU4610448.1 hypothetical protein [Verticiella sp. GG226]
MMSDDGRERLVKGMDAVMSDPAVIGMIESDGRGVLNVSGHAASIEFIRSEIDKFKAVAQGFDLR